MSGKPPQMVSGAHRTGVSASQGGVWKLQNSLWLEKTWLLLLPPSMSCTDASHWWTLLETRLGRESVSQEIAEAGGDNSQCPQIAPLSIVLLQRVEGVLLALI